MDSLKGKTVLITGGTTGIGRATAIAFAARDCEVVIAGRSETSGQEALVAINDAGGDAAFIRADVSNEGSVQKLVAKIVEQYGKLDCAVNNAGVEGEGIELAMTTQDHWSSLIDTNLKGIWLSLKYEILQMLEQGGGSIVNMASVLGIVANRSAIYTASKHGVIGLTKSAAITYADRHIRVNALCPGYIQTPMVERVFENNPVARENAVSRHPIGRLGDADEVAAAAVWLCSESASFVTGTAMAVDGGYSAR